MEHGINYCPVNKHAVFLLLNVLSEPPPPPWEKSKTDRRADGAGGTRNQDAPLNWWNQSSLLLVPCFRWNVCAGWILQQKATVCPLAVNPWYPIAIRNRHIKWDFTPVTSPQTAVWHLHAHPPSASFLFGMLHFTKAVNAQNPTFVSFRVHCDLDPQQVWPSECGDSSNVHFTELLLNPVRGIGFSRSGISPHCAIQNHFSCSFFRVAGRIGTTKRPGTLSKFGCFIIPSVYLMRTPRIVILKKDVCILRKLLCCAHRNGPNECLSTSEAPRPAM